MDMQRIIIEIYDVVLDSNDPIYEHWHVGITQRPEERRNEHEQLNERTTRWNIWQAESLKTARTIENLFKNEEGMQGGTGGDMDENKITYVYIF